MIPAAVDQRTSASTAPTGCERLVLLSAEALLHGAILAAIACSLVSAWILLRLDGARYYTTPIGLRGYDPAHAVLRPSGEAGVIFGIAGAVCMLVPFFYMLMKRVGRFRPSGRNLKTWLEIHIFFGLVGPVLVTFHTAFKFNGLVSVAYWSMVLVALSGFVGRYLYVRIPRTIRGVEICERELEMRATDLKEQLAWVLAPELAHRLERFEEEVVLCGEHRPSVSGFLFGGWRLRRRLRALRRELDGSAASGICVDETLESIAERAQLLRRLTYLHTSKKLFELWHVLHLPLVYAMFGIVSLHVALVTYLGYGTGR
jgi:hypothetical protein